MSNHLTFNDYLQFTTNNKESSLKTNKKDEYPEFKMFEGVIESSYFKLFRPIVGIKEELKGRY